MPKRDPPPLAGKNVTAHERSTYLLRKNISGGETVSANSPVEVFELATVHYEIVHY